MNYSSIVVLNLFLFFQRGESFQKLYQNGEKLFFGKVLRVLKNVLLLRPERRRDSSVG